MKRLLTYLKPHKWTMTFATLLVLFIIVVELSRPIISGDAIDDYINGYFRPYRVTQAGAPGAVVYHTASTAQADIYLTRDYPEFTEEDLASDDRIYYQLLLYEDQYYMAEKLTAAQTELLADAEPDTIRSYLGSYSSRPDTPLSKDELNELRRFDFRGILITAAACCCVGFRILTARAKRLNKELSVSSQTLQETFRRHIGDTDLSDQALETFRARMAEFKRLNAVTEQTEAAVQTITKELGMLNTKQNDCSDAIARQQKLQWELEKKLELLAGYKNEMESLKHTLAENARISQELAAIDLAQETMTDLSMSIRDSFGLYLNKTASDLIAGITGGIYSSMSIDENLNAFMNTRTKLVPIEQVSSGTMDQIYLAVRLAAAKLIQGEKENMPLIFDDSFVLYDDERLKSALKWLARSYGGQMIIFTCHQREAQMLTANQIEYNLIRI